MNVKTNLAPTSDCGTILYPNPAEKTTTIATNKEISSVEVRNTIGKIVTTSTTKSIEVANLPKGTYLVTIQFLDKSREIVELAIN